ncbi:hypothetical protein HELRODRAFT_163362 [Helobdella robusta]|uniref:Sushi domain-containing protein n=1 Tax=Helobdella robusta TaxID=6412 RepID=T1ETY2_HELRO|nr:hypothetical protein HELRODRAFT_163362 [Helobdella robusta]ESN96312.1 hypothetical protein HELRODRAFT_163362 [Helobdella robusta]
MKSGSVLATVGCRDIQLLDETYHVTYSKDKMTANLKCKVDERSWTLVCNNKSGWQGFVGNCTSHSNVVGSGRSVMKDSDSGVLSTASLSYSKLKVTSGNMCLVRYSC